MDNIETEAWREAYQKYSLKLSLSEADNIVNLQNVFTHYELCYDIIRKLESYCDKMSDKEFCVLNLEFAEVLIYDFGVNKDKITFITDSEHKKAFAESDRYKGIKVRLVQYNELLREKNNMKFDVVIMNPPYQSRTNKSDSDKGSGSRNTIWQNFVEYGLKIINDNGFLCSIHPPRWRKPEDKTGTLMKKQQIHYLEMHSKPDGVKTFGCQTPYDWYILQKKMPYKESTVVTYSKKVSKVNLLDFEFLPSEHIGIISRIVNNDFKENIDVIYNRSAYAPDKKWMSPTQSKIYYLPCIHSIHASGKIRTFWSSKYNGNGLGVKKIIIPDIEMPNPILDLKGEFGLTCHTFGIKIKSKKEGELIISAIKSEKFKKIIMSTKWSSFQTEWRMFKYFRKDFWKEFVDENGNEIV